jgi:hypothetical protein
MATKDPAEIPGRVRKLCQRFEGWRKGHKARLPIPEELWSAAADAAREHGVYLVAKALRLEYGKLKRIVEAGPAPTGTPPTFLELVPPPAVAVPECLVELEGPRGKMRIQWKGTTPPDLAGLSRALWEPA